MFAHIYIELGTGAMYLLNVDTDELFHIEPNALIRKHNHFYKLTLLKRRIAVLHSSIIAHHAGFVNRFGRLESFLTTQNEEQVKVEHNLCE